MAQLTLRSLADWPKNGTATRILLVFFGLVAIIAPLLNHYFFRTYAFDYGAYNFAFHDYSHLSVSPNPVYWYEDTSFMQDHLSFTLFFLTPFYWALKWLLGTYTLLFLQSLFIIWGAWASYKLILERTESEIYGLLTIILYFTLYGRYSALTGDCNLMIILASFVPVFLLYFHRGKTLIAVLCFLFLILGRESMPLWTFFISILLMIIYRKDRQKLKLAAIFCASSVVYFIIAFKLLIPYFENPNRPFDLFTYGELGDTPFEALKFMFTHPIDTIKLLFTNQSGEAIYDNVKSEFYYVYLLSGGIILFWRPVYVIPFIPIIAQKMFNDAPVRWGIESYYGIEFVSLLPILIFFVLGSMERKKVGYFLGSVACIMAISFTVYKLKPENKEIPWMGAGKTNILESAFYKSDIPVKKINDLLNQIPANAKVSATGNIVPHLAFRDQINYYPMVPKNIDYVVILDYGDHFLMTLDELKTNLSNLKKDSSYTVVHSDAIFHIFKKNK